MNCRMKKIQLRVHQIKQKNGETQLEQCLVGSFGGALSS